MTSEQERKRGIAWRKYEVNFLSATEKYKKAKAAARRTFQETGTDWDTYDQMIMFATHVYEEDITLLLKVYDKESKEIIANEKA